MEPNTIIYIAYWLSAVAVAPAFAWKQMTSARSFTVGDLILIIGVALTPIVNTVLLISIVVVMFMESRIISKFLNIQLYKGGKS